MALVAEQREQREQHPLFELYTLDEIATATGWAMGTLLNFRGHYREPSARFRKVASLAFRRPERDLFVGMEAGDAA